MSTRNTLDIINITIRFDGAELDQGLGVHIVSFTSKQELSQPFEHTLVLQHERDQTQIWEKLPGVIKIGANADIQIKQDSGETRWFHGEVSEISYEPDSGMARILMTPKGWAAGIGVNSLVYGADLKISDVIKKVFSNELGERTVRVDATPDKKAWIIRFNETPLDFIGRLCAEAGLYYFYEFDRGGYDVVVRKRDATATEKEYELSDDTMASVSFRQVPKKVSVAEFAPKTNKVNLSKHDSTDAPKLKSALENKYGHLGATGSLDVKTRPSGDPKVLDARTESLGAQLTADAVEVTGRAGPNVSGIEAGCKLNIDAYKSTGHGSYDQFLCLSSVFTLADGIASVNFVAVSAKFGYVRPIDNEPVISGLQTAIVVETGRQKSDGSQLDVAIEFHWDAMGEGRKTPVWARVATGLSSGKRGIFMSPQIGDEVVVIFVNGDPDRPIVVGAVTNSKTNHTSISSDIFTSNHENTVGISFDDASFAYWRNEDAFWISGTHNLVMHIDGHAYIVHGKKEGNEGIRSYMASPDDQKVTDQYSVEVERKYDETLDMDVAKDITVKAGQKMTFDAGTEVLIKAGTKLTLKVGNNTVVMDNAGITVKGTKVAVTADTMLEMKGNATAKLEGGGMAEIKGGVVKIN